MTAILLGVPTLLVAIYVAVLETCRWRRDGTANVRYVKHRFIWNSAAPCGQQIIIEMHNRGPADAQTAATWLQPAGGVAAPTWDTDQASTLDVGSGASQRLDIPTDHATAKYHIWLSWRDKRGLQARDTGIVVRVPAE